MLSDSVYVFDISFFMRHYFFPSGTMVAHRHVVSREGAISGNPTTRTKEKKPIHPKRAILSLEHFSGVNGWLPCGRKTLSYKCG